MLKASQSQFRKYRKLPTEQPNKTEQKTSSRSSWRLETGIYARKGIEDKELITQKRELNKTQLRDLRWLDSPAQLRGADLGESEKKEIPYKKPNPCKQTSFP